MRKLLIGAALAALLAACGQQGGGSQTASPKTVEMDGSSTVFPVSEAFAEEFQKSGTTRVAVGVSGTGGGFKKFCRGEIDIAAASRPIKAEEAETCAAANIEFVELPIAIDALAVVVNPQNNWAQCLTVDELKTAWAPESEGKVSAWNQVRAGFPAEKLLLFAPGSDSGTFDYFTETVNGKGGTSRTDFTASEDDNIILNGVSTNKGGFGYLGLAYVTNSQGRVKAVQIKSPAGACVDPSLETARSGAYAPLSRPLFYYVNKASLERKKHVADYLTFAFNAENAPFVEQVGYVPLPAAAYAKVNERLTAKTSGAMTPADITAMMAAQ